MADDLASLRIQVDVEDIAKAIQKLDDFARAGNNTEQTASKLINQLGRMGATAQQLQAALDSLYNRGILPMPATLSGITQAMQNAATAAETNAGASNALAGAYTALAGAASVARAAVGGVGSAISGVGAG